MMNHSLLYPVMQGIFRTGGTAIPVMPQAAAAELRYVLADTEAQFIVTDVERLPTVREAVAGLRHVSGDSDSGGRGRSSRPAARDSPGCTAGTPPEEHAAANRHHRRRRDALLRRARPEGPRAVLLTHGNLLE